MTLFFLESNLDRDPPPWYPPDNSTPTNKHPHKILQHKTSYEKSPGYSASLIHTSSRSYSLGKDHGSDNVSRNGKPLNLGAFSTPLGISDELGDGMAPGSYALQLSAWNRSYNDTSEVRGGGTGRDVGNGPLNLPIHVLAGTTTEIAYVVRLYLPAHYTVALLSLNGGGLTAYRTQLVRASMPEEEPTGNAPYVTSCKGGYKDRRVQKLGS